MPRPRKNAASKLSDPPPAKRQRRPSAKARQSVAGHPTNPNPANSTPQKSHPSQSNIGHASAPSLSEPVGPTAGTTYFEACRSTRTSNFTLADLSHIPPPVLHSALASLPNPHEEEQKHLHQAARSTFEWYLRLLHTNHSLLFHGFGSKRQLLEDLAKEMGKYWPVVIVDGFNPTVTLRAMLAELLVAMSDRGSGGKRATSDTVKALKDAVEKGKQVGLVVHNIDGVALRTMEVQEMLAEVAALDGVNLAASVDHVNAPLLWDGALAAKFAWVWMKCDTLMGYEQETMFATKGGILKGGEERKVEAAVALLRSLSGRARKVFRMLAEEQTKGEEGAISFGNLFEKARRAYLVADAASLRLILTELRTHELLEEKRASDGSTMIKIPLAEAELKEVLDIIAE